MKRVVLFSLFGIGMLVIVARSAWAQEAEPPYESEIRISGAIILDSSIRDQNGNPVCQRTDVHCETQFFPGVETNIYTGDTDINSCGPVACPGKNLWIISSDPTIPGRHLFQTGVRWISLSGFDALTEQDTSIPQAVYVYSEASAFDSGEYTFLNPHGDIHQGTERDRSIRQGSEGIYSCYGLTACPYGYEYSYEARLGERFVTPIDWNALPETSRGGTFWARVDEVPTTTNRVFTFSDQVNPTIFSDQTPTWDVDNLEVRFGEGRQLVVEGELEASGVTFAAADANDGWAGIDVREDANLTLTGQSLVHQVKRTAGQPPAHPAISVAGGTALLDGANVWNNQDQGLYVAGGGSQDGAVRITGGSLIGNPGPTPPSNGGVGVQVGNGGFAQLDGGATRVRWNGAAGVTVSGSMARAQLLDAVRVVNNTGPGLRANAGGVIEVLRKEASTGESFGGDYTSDPIVVQGNGGGGRLTNAAEVNTGYVVNCPQPPCDHPVGGNTMGNNNRATRYDVNAASSSLDYSPNNYWDVQSVNDLVLVEDKSLIVVEPILTQPPSLSGVTASVSSEAETPSDSPSGVSNLLRELLEQAEAARREVRPAAALVKLGLAWLTAPSDHKGVVWERIGRLALEESRAPDSIPGLAAWIEEHGASTVDAPYRLRALAQMHLGRSSGEGFAEELVEAYPGTDHAAFGYEMLIERAIAAGDEQGAVQTFGAFAAAFPDRVHDVALRVLAAFPEAEIDGALTEHARLVASVNGAEESGDTGISVRIYPNPATTEAMVRIRSEERAEVTIALYDILGRQVLRVREEALASGITDIPLSLGILSAGVYSGQVEMNADVVPFRLTVIR